MIYQLKPTHQEMLDSTHGTWYEGNPFWAMFDGLFFMVFGRYPKSRYLKRHSIKLKSRRA